MSTKMHEGRFCWAAEQETAQITRRTALFGTFATLLAATTGCRTASGPVDLWLGGDLHLGDGGPVMDAALLRHLAGVPGVVNLEGPVGAVDPDCGREVCLANAPQALVAMSHAGIAAAGINNNHAQDLGEDAPADTARALTTRGLAAVGAAGSVLVQRGRGVTLTAHDLTGGLPPDLAAELRAARLLADDLVASFHVTGPPSLLPRPELVAAAELALAAGARVVVGHGSHALAPVERRGDAVIAWGLGNLRFACDCTRERDAILLRITLGPGPVQASVLPIDAGLSGAPASLARDPAFTFEVLTALGSTPLDVRGREAVLR